MVVVLFSFKHIFPTWQSLLRVYSTARSRYTRQIKVLFTIGHRELLFLKTKCAKLEIKKRIIFIANFSFFLNYYKPLIETLEREVNGESGSHQMAFGARRQNTRTRTRLKLRSRKKKQNRAPIQLSYWGSALHRLRNLYSLTWCSSLKILCTQRSCNV